MRGKREKRIESGYNPVNEETGPAVPGYWMADIVFLIHNSPEQAPLLAAALIGACRAPDGWASPAQPRILAVLFEKLLGFRADFETLQGAEPEEIATALVDPDQRRELIELMATTEMMCRPIPRALQIEVERWASVLGVEDSVLTLARDLASQAELQATADFYRLNWIGEGAPQDQPHFQELLKANGPMAYALTLEPDLEEVKRWARLESCQKGSLGQALWQFYRKHDFKLPGEVGGATSALAHHDWVHVIADYETSAIGELEVTAFMASASRMPGAMLGFVGAVSLYETGLLQSVVTHSYSQTLSGPGGAERVAAAIQKGKMCRVDPLLGIDYFEIADKPLDEVRREWGLEA